MIARYGPHDTIMARRRVVRTTAHKAGSTKSTDMGFRESFEITNTLKIFILLYLERFPIPKKRKPL
jgi:hypothetical protein